MAPRARLFGTRSSAESPTRGIELSGLVYTADSPIAELLDRLGPVAASGAPVVFWGEAGSGRRTFGHILHERSARRERVMQRFKSGPTSTRAELEAVLASAKETSLLIEETPRLATALQEQLADFLDSAQADGVRIMATFIDEPGTLVASGELAEELFYRLGVFSLRIPPLRERPSDIRSLAKHFIALANRRHGVSVTGVSEEASDHLVAADWPGNVPDLKRTIDHAAILVGSGTICLQHLPTEYLEGVRQPRPVVVLPGTPMAEAERRLILATLEQTGQNKAEAARRLGLDVKTVRNKLRSYGLM